MSFKSPPSVPVQRGLELSVDGEQERAIGGKHDLPSVSRLHFEDQETEGTSRDLPIVRRLDVTDYSPRSKSSPRSALSLPNIRSPGTQIQPPERYLGLSPRS